jgi:hypothetical protein
MVVVDFGVHHNSSFCFIVSVTFAKVFFPKMSVIFSFQCNIIFYQLIPGASFPSHYPSLYIYVNDGYMNA